MSLLLAFDSFKDSLSSAQAAKAFARGFRKVDKETRIETILLSDGGEGFVDAVLQTAKGRKHSHHVHGSLGRKRQSSFAMLSGKTAVIEMADASGLEQVPLKSRNPMKTTSAGTGELMAAALEQGANRLLLGVGGSAVVDGGTGMAQALGVRFFDKKGKELKKLIKGADMLEIRAMDTGNLHPAFKDCELTVACDVSNTLCGPQGAARVFGPQKGATPSMVKKLEVGLENLADILEEHSGKKLRRKAGTGAAGGITAMLAALGSCNLQSGADLVMETSGFEKRLRKANMVITGEGSLDRQTPKGKAVSGVITAAAEYGIPVLAIGGRIIEKELGPLYKNGLSATLPLCSEAVPLEVALTRAEEWMQDAGSRVARMLSV